MFKPQPGTRIGHYELLASLGAGGMGEVYRAHDTKLGRDVALKFLRSEFTGDADRLHRFQREARVLASLNHPHIGQIYGLEESEGHSCLVLELVEGESLDERLQRGPVPADEALGISRQIAEAIEAAHASGILHRDLKPANIKRAASGEVKVLDFGLGKVLETQPELSESPTRLTQVTQPNVLLGTLAYMSPEQVRGGTTDERSDVWAFGCVLYELLTARRAFTGSSAADTIGAITKTDPDFSLLPSSTSPNIRRLLRRCLQKNPTSRLQHIGDARLEIEEELAGPREESEPTTPRRRVSLLWVGIGAAFGAAAVWMLLHLSSTAPTLPKMRLEVSVPGQVNRTNAWLAISPNARQIVFEQNYQRQNMFWIRSMESTELRPLPGTERGMFPFWSPDNRSIAFFSDGKLRRIEVSGGPPQVIADAQNPRVVRGPPMERFFLMPRRVDLCLVYRWTEALSHRPLNLKRIRAAIGIHSFSLTAGTSSITRWESPKCRESMSLPSIARNRNASSPTPTRRRFMRSPDTCSSCAKAFFSHSHSI
jgi:serine/threonine protein kinase